jgi:hypothetical protein
VEIVRDWKNLEDALALACKQATGFFGKTGANIGVHLPPMQV